MFDRPGFYRFYTKNMDTEYGMVKEEVLARERYRECECVFVRESVCMRAMKIYTEEERYQY